MTINVRCLTDTDYAVMAGDYEANPPGADEVSSVDTSAGTSDMSTWS
jgi:hypothetical protein